MVYKALIAIGVLAVAVVSYNFYSTPGQADFGSVTMGQYSAPQTLTVTNGSPTQSAILTGVSIVGVDPNSYTILPGGSCQVGSTLGPLGTCTVTIRFKPDVVGTSNASLQVQGNWE
jgi:hypothetical protein